MLPVLYVIVCNEWGQVACSILHVATTKQITQPYIMAYNKQRENHDSNLITTFKILTDTFALLTISVQFTSIVKIKVIQRNDQLATHPLRQ